MVNPKVSFKINKKLEVLNYYLALTKESYGHKFTENLPKNLEREIEGKSKKEIEEILEKQIEVDYEKNKDKIDLVLKQTEEKFREIEDKFFNRLRKITKRPFLAKEVSVYVTLISRCDYNPDPEKPWFKISVIFQPCPETQIKIMAHEMLHFIFNWYNEKEAISEIGAEKASHLKEALTFLLNEEFQDMIELKDKGYDIHKELRERLASIWRKERDYDMLLKESYKIMKEWKPNSI